MPYKDPQAKKEWERRHRDQRIARRRELRQIDTTRKQTRCEAVGALPGEESHGGSIGAIAFVAPIIAGGALAAYNPKVAMGAGGVTVAVAAIFKKGAGWWVVGILVLLLGLFFYWSDLNGEEASKDSEPPRPIPL